ncbi:DsbA family protein [Loktanella sp. S4079]|uniref:DsbA family protein n=1 Tax=Loktanella sp. S4079 TaxID=579483 RepID=UPI0005FA2BA0|nr:DsbA family protein [Loktanella sp. S4079]KJZ19307.1 thiol-disulfide oxidoreductase [Loktanella sp. S4079]
MKRRTLLATGGAAVLTMGAGLGLLPRNQQTGLLPGAANAQEATGELPEVIEMVVGNPLAKVEVIEYASFTCPHCASFNANQHKLLKENYIDTNLIRFVYREVYFDRPGLWASMIARCTDNTEFFFAFSDLLYQQQREWLASGDPATIIQDLRRLGKTAGLDDAALDACLSDAAKAEALYTWYQDNAERDGINSTPSFMIDGEKYSNMNYDEFAAILDEKLG